MRVLTIGNRYPPESLGGYEEEWRGTVSWLLARGHEVRVLACDRPAPEPDPAYVARRLRWYWHDHEFPPVAFRARVARERFNGRVLADELASFRPDVVAWFGMGGMSMALVERVRRARVPAVGVVADEWMNYGPLVDPWTRTWRGKPVPRTLFGVPTRFRPGPAARWLFNSERLRRNAPADGEVVSPGPDPALFPAHPPHEWRGRLICVGRLDPRKGVATAVRALEHLPGMELEVIGGGDEAYAAELRALAPARVRFDRVPHEELAARYAAADVALFPVEWEEPWGLVPLEAMAVGTPVVGTDAEYLRDGENCLRHEKGDPAALAAAVLRLRDDPELRACLRAGGLATAARYTAPAFHAAVEEALRVACGR